MRPLPILLILAATATSGALGQVPDLATLFVNCSPSTVVPGASVTVTYDVENRGGLCTAQTWEDRILFNTSPSTSGATELWTFCRLFNIFICPGQRYSNWGANFAVPVTIPQGLARGTYYIGYQANRNGGRGDRCGPHWAIPESNTSNNVRWAQVIVEGGPDFVVSSLSAAPSRTLPGQTITIDAVLENRGGGLGNGSVSVDFYLSPSSAPGGTRLLRQTVLLAPGSPVNLQQGITMPAVPLGSYNLVAVIDPENRIAETNETNNTASTPLAVSPDPSVTVFGTACPGRLGVPAIAAIGLPSLGNSSFAIEASNLPDLTFAALMLGASRTTCGGVTLPLPIPGTSCFLLVCPDLVLATPVQNGGVRYDLPIPNETELIDMHVYAQVFDFDAVAMPAVLMTAGLDHHFGL